MRNYLIRPPFIYRWLFSEALFRGSSSEKVVYLTFDDGPHPEATPFILDVLKSHQVKATFFLLGKNAATYPDLVQQMKNEGHIIGNHGMNHLNGWQSNVNDYVADVAQGKSATGTNQFRPPYGKLGLRQYQQLKKTEHIVFWDVISGDFDQSQTGAQVVDNVLSNVRNGSIIVMHESAKSLNNVKSSLKEIITQLLEKGFRFDVIQQQLHTKKL